MPDKMAFKLANLSPAVWDIDGPCLSLRIHFSADLVRRPTAMIDRKARRIDRYDRQLHYLITYELIMNGKFEQNPFISSLSTLIPCHCGISVTEFGLCKTICD